MNRRELLKKLGIGGAALGTVGLISQTAKSEETKSDKLEYKGFKLSWSGWRSYVDSDKATGFWIANSDKINFYSSTGGYVTEYNLGYIFNVCVLEGHHFITMNSPEEHKEEEKSRALNALKETIDKYNFAPDKWDSYVPEYKFGFAGFKP